MNREEWLLTAAIFAVAGLFVYALVFNPTLFGVQFVREVLP